MQSYTLSYHHLYNYIFGIVHSYTFIPSGFHDEECTFGIMKKGSYRPASDFNFEFVAEVLCSNALHSGYMVNVTSERSHATNPNQCTRYNGIIFLLSCLE